MTFIQEVKGKKLCIGSDQTHLQLVKLQRLVDLYEFFHLFHLPNLGVAFIYNLHVCVCDYRKEEKEKYFRIHSKHAA